jgi:hypothetical protein
MMAARTTADGVTAAPAAMEAEEIVEEGENRFHDFP